MAGFHSTAFDTSWLHDPEMFFLPPWKIWLFSKVKINWIFFSGILWTKSFKINTSVHSAKTTIKWKIRKWFLAHQTKSSAVSTPMRKFYLTCRERSGLVVECLTQDRGTAGSSLTSVTLLCPWSRHINPSLVLIQPRKTRLYITERLLMGRKESDQTNKLYYMPDTNPFERYKWNSCMCRDKWRHCHIKVTNCKTHIFGGFFYLRYWQ